MSFLQHRLARAAAATIAVTALLSACAAQTPAAPSVTGASSPATATSTRPTRSFFAGPIPALATGDAAAPSIACTRDDDCVLSCDIDGRCCPELCQCTNAYHRAFASKLRAHIVASCGDAPCPIARCILPARVPSAVCQQNACTVRWTDVPTAPAR